MGRVLPPFKEAKGPIVYYVPEGGWGFQKSVVYQNFPPKKELHMKVVPPPGNT